jgi:formylmethanofuran dehydrogenase subunit E
MGSLIAYFHKQFRHDEHKMRSHKHMNKSIRRMQKRARQRNFFPCDKCGELFKKEELEQVPEINERFCKDCLNLMKLARDDY